VIANGGKTIEVRVVADVAGMPAVRPGPSAAAVPASNVRPVAVQAAPTAVSARAGVPVAIPTAPHAAASVALKQAPAVTERSNILASLLILPLLFLALRLVMVPISDGYLRSAALRSAAHQLDVKVTEDSPVGGWAGWLRLPWPSIMGGDNAVVSNALFDPNNHGSLAVGALRDYFVGSFVRTLALSTWWIGGLLGALLLWRRGGVLDVPWGFIAGAVGGLAGAATLASVFLVVEMLPQFVWHVVSGDSGGPAAWLAWIAVALVSWLVVGTGLGTACALLPPLRRLVLLPLQRIPAALLRTMGMQRAAAFWWSASHTY
jgi:hypothetical protein